MKDNDDQTLSINTLTVFQKIIIFDLWLLINFHRLYRLTLKWLIPILKNSIIFILGCGLFLAHIFNQSRCDVTKIKDISFQKENKVINKYLEIHDNSQFDTISLQKKLIKMKIEQLHLETSLRKMNLHLENLHNRQKNNDLNLADFASETVGGIVISTPDTESYFPQKTQLTLFGVPIWKFNFYTPRKVIQPWTEPGECWSFHGSHGKIEIELAYAVIINKVTLEHIPASATFTGKIDTAPKIFNVLGKIDDHYMMIDTFVYAENGPSSQTFRVTKANIKNFPVKRVILEILSNWGNPEYTCVYRFKVHGKIYV